MEKSVNWSQQRKLKNVILNTHERFFRLKKVLIEVYSEK